MKYYITETITRAYFINSDSIENAIEAAFEIDDFWDYEESNHGFTYIQEIETGIDKLL